MKTLDGRTHPTERAHSHMTWLYKVSGMASMILGVLFLIAMMSLITTDLRPNATNDLLTPFENNWLVVLFKLNAGYDGVQFDL